MSARLEQLRAWLREVLGPGNYTLVPASEDASFRRYFRVQVDGRSFIVMDAPPQHEDCGPFLDIALRLRAARVNVPEVLEQDPAQGFLLLTDLGTTLYLHALTEDNADQLYAEAINSIVSMQQKAGTSGLPPYDETLLRNEMQLFPDWLLKRHLQIELSTQQQRELEKTFDLLVNNALSQPKVFVHRDYHSRNLMVCPGKNPGIVDFQDAVFGPVSYDLVSLLKDCYIKWPEDRIRAWLLAFFSQARLPNVDEALFLRWFDLMGVQRHLKASGIFARLYHRDRKSGFLKDIPRTLSYITDLDGKYPELEFLAGLIKSAIYPGLDEVNRACVP